MIEIVEKLTQNGIVEAIGRVMKRSNKKYYVNTIVMSEEKFNIIKRLPGYNSDTLYGKTVINNERGNIEGLVVRVSEEYKDMVYVINLPLNK